jgi:hypothetical protein
MVGGGRLLSRDMVELAIFDGGVARELTGPTGLGSEYAVPVSGADLSTGVPDAQPGLNRDFAFS